MEENCWSNQVTMLRSLFVTVYDAVRRRTARRRLAAHASDPSRLSSIDALVVTRWGAAAFVVRHPGGGAGSVGLRALDASGSRLLDKGEGIDPASLRLEGSLLWWRHAGRQHVAQLR